MNLIDLDCDFMLGGDYNIGKQGWPQESRVAIGGKAIARRIEKFITPQTKIYFGVDHQESLYFWDKNKIKNAVCYHIDAHHDCWSGFEYGSVQRFDRTRTHCGNYLSQAIVDGVIKYNYFVPAFYKSNHEAYDLQIYLNKNLFSVLRWNDFIWKEFEADILTIAVSPEWFPPSEIQHIIDLCKYFDIEWTNIIKKANKKWEIIGTPLDTRKREGDVIEQFDFCFPYKTVPEAV